MYAKVESEGFLPEGMVEFQGQCLGDPDCHVCGNWRSGSEVRSLATVDNAEHHPTTKEYSRELGLNPILSYTPLGSVTGYVSRSWPSGVDRICKMGVSGKTDGPYVKPGFNLICLTYDYLKMESVNIAGS